MRPLLVLCSLLAIALCQFFVLETNIKATLEDLSKSKDRCEQFIVSPKTERKIDKNELLDRICAPGRHKRYWWAPVSIRQVEREEFDRVHDDVASDYRSVIRNSTSLTLKTFEEKFQNVGENFSARFNYPPGRFADVWKATENKTLHCNQHKQMVLTACGRWSPQREWGSVETVVPIGKFSSRGTIYKVRDIYELAVNVDGKLSTVTDCRVLESYLECWTMGNETCTVTDYKNCNETVHFVPSKVFVRTVGLNTKIVAADVDEYATQINGKYVRHPMDFSKHVVLKLPEGSFAEFNGIRVNTTASLDNVFDHFVVHQEPDDLSPVSAHDLDYLEKEHGEHPEITEHRAALVSPSRFGTTLRYLAVIIPSVLLLVVLVLVVYWKLHKKDGANNVVHFSVGEENVNIGFVNLNHAEEA